MASDLSFLAEIGLFARFARGLGGYLRQPLTVEECRERIERDLRAREANFCRILEQGVFARPESAYRKLFEHAGLGMRDVQALVEANGLEGALEALFDAGVYLRLDEFKGRRPIQRGSLQLEVSSRDFTNPLTTGHLMVQTGGSRSGGTRIYIDLEHYTQDAVHYAQFLACFGLFERPYALWRPVPPWHAGIKGVFRCAKLGKVPDKWFTQNRLAYTSRAWKQVLLTTYAIHASRFHGRSLPVPEHVPLSEAWRVAEWLAANSRAGSPAVLNTNASSGVRVCMVARERGLDISGTLFRVGGEPLTAAKSRLFREAGCRVVCAYIMGEAGTIGLPCSNPAALDDVHILSNSVALIQRSQSVGGAHHVMANVYTTLLANTPKLMVNVVSDDYGVVERRSCGCPLDRLGYGLHLHTIRSYEKLTSEGMTFIGSDLIRLVEDVLPARFGGGATDYQFVEEEENGLPKVNLVISPRVGPIDEPQAIDAVIGFLKPIPNASDDYGERWREARTLRVVRSEPHVTGASKILALHVTKPKLERAEATRR